MVSACHLPAHSGPPSAAVDSGQCGSIEALLQQGDSLGRMSGPLARVRSCPELAGRLVSEQMLALRQSEDVGSLDDATYLTQYVHDASVFDAAIHVASDRQASDQARVFALRALLWAKAPGHLMPFQSMIDGPRCAPPRCSSTYTGHFHGPGPFAGDTVSWPVWGQPMPSDFVQVIDEIARRLADDRRNSGAVRAAARTVLMYPQDRQMADKLGRRTH